MITLLKWAIVVGAVLFSASANADTIKMRVAYPSGMNGQIPVVLEKTRIPVKYGLDVEYNFFQNGPPMMEALASENVDVVITSLMPIASFLSKQPGKGMIVAQLGASSHSLLVPKDSHAKSIADLRKKRIAVSFFTDSHLDLLNLIKSAGMDPAKDVKLMNTPPNELMLVFSQGFADAIVVRTPQSQRMQKQFGAKEIKVWPFRFAVLMSSSYMKKYPSSKEKLVSALEEAVAYIASNRLQSAQWFAEKLRMDPKIVLQATGVDPLFSRVAKADDVKIEITPAFHRLLNQWMETSMDHGLIKTKVDVAASVAK